MASDSDLHGPGLMLVQSRITSTDLLDETTLMDWYDNEHIPEILATGGIRAALRLKHAARDAAAFPFLALYPVSDLAFLTTPTFRNIAVTSARLPGSGLCYDLALFSVGYYALVEAAAPLSASSTPAQAVVLEQVDVAAGKDEEVEDTALDAWYRTEHLPALAATAAAATAGGYLRTTRYVLRLARSNDQSRQFKGLSGTGAAPAADEVAVPSPAPKRPKWLAVHEFAAGDAATAVTLVETVRNGTAGGKRVQAAASQWTTDGFDRAREHGVFSLVSR